jgi:hypothetical protein
MYHATARQQAVDESVIQNQLRIGVLGLALVFASYAAAAPRDWIVANDSGFLTFAQEHRLVLSNAQERAVLRAVRKQNHKQHTILSGFEPEIGQPVPPSITLRRLPSEATSRVWAVRSYAYVLTPTQLLIVNPQDRIVDDIIGY